MKIRFLADANFNQKIVSGLLLREPRIDFELPQNVIPEKMADSQVLELGAARGRIIVTYDVRTMPDHFSDFVAGQPCRANHVGPTMSGQPCPGHPCPGMILVPKKMPIGVAIEDLLLIWQVSEAGEWIDQMRRLPLQRPMPPRRPFASCHDRFMALLHCVERAK